MTEGSSILLNKDVNTANDPIRLMVEIVKDDEISPEDKKALFIYINSRFKNRRRMAYISLTSIVLSLLFIFIAAFVKPEAFNLIKDNQTLLIWIEGFLASIVATYFGMSSWRPTS